MIIKFKCLSSTYLTVLVGLYSIIEIYQKYLLLVDFEQFRF